MDDKARLRAGFSTRKIFFGEYFTKSEAATLCGSSPATPGTGPPAAIPPPQNLGGMFNGLLGNVFENNNWWLWAALLFIFFNPDLRKKLIGKSIEADRDP